MACCIGLASPPGPLPKKCVLGSEIDLGSLLDTEIRSTGHAFVSFEGAAEASRAVAATNKKMLFGAVLDVTLDDTLRYDTGIVGKKSFAAQRRCESKLGIVTEEEESQQPAARVHKAVRKPCPSCGSVINASNIARHQRQACKGGGASP